MALQTYRITLISMYCRRLNHSNVTKRQKTQNVTRTTTLPLRGKNDHEMEFLGGDADDIDDGGFEEELPQCQPEVVFSLPEAQAILSRSVEFKRLEKPGMHRESDIQMKHFCDLFANFFKNDLPQFHQNTDSASMYIWGSQAENVAEHQAAVAKFLREEDVVSKQCSTDSGSA